MSRFDSDGNYIQPKYELHNGKIEFDANYGRTGVVQLTHGKCLGCGQSDSCLFVDQSDGEYNPALICRACINAILR